MNFNPLSLERQIMKTDKVSYYSCRAPNGEFFLIAEPHRSGFAEKIAQLRARRNEFMESVGFTEVSECKTEECSFRGNCLRINFLPEVNSQIRLVVEGLYVLEFDCFTFGKMIYAKDLLENDYYITMPTAYRLTIGLLTLVDRMVRMNMYVNLTAENLLIDTQFAMATLLDWSEVELFDIMSTQKTTALYRHVAELIFQLTGAERNEDGSWNCLDDSEDKLRDGLLNVLDEVKQTQVEIPERLDEAISYVQKLREKQKSLVREIAKRLPREKFKKPLFEVMKKEKTEEKEWNS